MTTKFAIVRHGITDWNQQKRSQGQSDVPLNALGREQAAGAARRFTPGHWELIYSSDLGRAVETARCIAEQTGLSIRTDARLRELNYGRLEGTTLEERLAQWGDGWAELDHGVETYEALGQRGRLVFEELAATHPGAKIVVVSHGAFIKHTLTVLLGLAEPLPQLKNAAVSIIERREDGWHCLLHNSQDAAGMVDG